MELSKTALISKKSTSTGTAVISQTETEILSGAPTSSATNWSKGPSSAPTQTLTANAEIVSVLPVTKKVIFQHRVNSSKTGVIRKRKIQLMSITLSLIVNLVQNAK
jgi:hypothetical protein